VTGRAYGLKISASITPYGHGMYFPSGSTPLFFTATLSVEEGHVLYGVKQDVWKGRVKGKSRCFCKDGRYAVRTCGAEIK